MTTSSKHKLLTADLSPIFLKTVFQDPFIFGGNPEAVLKKAKLNAAQCRLAWEIHSSYLYSNSSWDSCANICNRLSDVFHWQSNSEGPIIFAGKILYLLERSGHDVEWFKTQISRESLPPRQRATVIVPTDSGLLLTTTSRGLSLLPGGGIERGELPIAAAARELFEETRLFAQDIRFLFEHVSEHYLHQVFLVAQTRGEAMAASDAAEIYYLHPQEVREEHATARITRSNVEILRRYMSQRRGRER